MDIFTLVGCTMFVVLCLALYHKSVAFIFEGVALACAGAGLMAMYHNNNLEGKELFAVTAGCLFVWGILSLFKESS